MKLTLMLYALLHQFIHQTIEGHELYIKVHHNLPPALLSEGWTVVLMDCSSGFLWELICGRKDRQLFETPLKRLLEVIQQTPIVNLFTDGERRCGKRLFEICHEVMQAET